MEKKSRFKVGRGIVLYAALAFAIIGSSNCGSSSSTAENERYIRDPLMRVIVSPGVAYPYGMGYAFDEADSVLQTEYLTWRANYVVNDSATGGCRVQRDATTDYDTVSEGIGYGMLLAVYFGDKNTFDGLVKYWQAHLVKNPGVPNPASTDTNDLDHPSKFTQFMHWRVDKNGVNIDECGYNTPHEAVWYPTASNPTIDPSKYNPSNPVGSVFQASSPGAGYAKYLESRGLTSATDADEDMGAALVFAHKRWGSSSVTNYYDMAHALIKDLLDRDMVPDSGWRLAAAKGGMYGMYLSDGYYLSVTGQYAGAWGGKESWSPSYFTPAWYRVFSDFIAPVDSTRAMKWVNLSMAIDSGMAIIRNNIYNSTGGAGPFLFPDFVNLVYPGFIGDAHRSMTKTGWDKWEFGGSDRGPQSYNFYYDSARVPWRMAVDYSWYGNHQSQLDDVNAFFKSKLATNSINNGYQMNGQPWDVNIKDPFNPGTASDTNTATWYSMIGTAVLASGDATYAKNFYDKIKATKDPVSGGHYYGNTLRLLSLLYLSGHFVNLAEQPLYNVSVSGKINTENGQQTNMELYVKNDGTTTLKGFTFRYFVDFTQEIGAGKDISKIVLEMYYPNGGTKVKPVLADSATNLYYYEVTLSSDWQVAAGATTNISFAIHCDPWWPELLVNPGNDWSHLNLVVGSTNPAVHIPFYLGTDLVCGEAPVKAPPVADFIELKNQYSGKLATVTSNSNLASVVCQGLNTSWTSQSWISESASGSNIRLKNRWTGRYLTVTSNADYASVVCQDLNTSWTSQQWTVENVLNGSVRLKNVWSGKYLTVTNTSEGASIKAQNLNTSWTSQQWWVE